MTDTVLSESDMSHVIRQQEKRMQIEIFKGAEHNESAWANQAEIPLLFFFETE